MSQEVELGNLPKISLKVAYKAMLYVARAEAEEGEIDEKYEKLADAIDLHEDLSVTDMIDNLENFYKVLADDHEEELVEEDNNMTVQRKFDKYYSWDVLSFFINEEEVGFMNIDFSSGNHAFIFTMNSYQSGKGIGTKMIHYLRDNFDIVTVSGDADPDSIGFWGKFNPEWNGDSFRIDLTQQN